MTLDLSGAVDAAYLAWRQAQRGSPLAPGEFEATHSRVEAEWMTAALTAAAPLIEQAVREQVAGEIEAEAGKTEAARGLVGAWAYLNIAARIARGGAS